MDQPMKKYDLDVDYDRYGLDRGFESEKGADAAGYWFAAAVFFAFLAAGIIIYRTAGDEFRTASNDPPQAARSGPIDHAPILPQR